MFISIIEAAKRLDMHPNEVERVVREGHVTGQTATTGEMLVDVSAIDRIADLKRSYGDDWRLHLEPGRRSMGSARNPVTR